MPTRSASDYLSFVKAQVLSQTATAVPQARNVLRYQNSFDQIRAVTQVSAMSYVTRGQVAPARVISRPFVMNRSNPKNLSQVGILSSGGVLGPVVSRPVPRTSGTAGLIVLQSNLIQNANASAKGSTTFTNTNQSTSGGAF